MKKQTRQILLARKRQGCLGSTKFPDSLTKNLETIYVGQFTNFFLYPAILCYFFPTKAPFSTTQFPQSGHSFKYQFLSHLFLISPAQVASFILLSCCTHSKYFYQLYCWLYHFLIFSFYPNFLKVASITQFCFVCYFYFLDQIASS